MFMFFALGGDLPLETKAINRRSTPWGAILKGHDDDFPETAGED
ncbi:hypothetical protein CGMCC3_g1253 [Colletotrichum fructicola]|nr:uncharacterized protein CGMCC3_g1253 [Colletotrichum fructicola]KAE9583306.1 hypothetical protein CGMCC3_g1253 [Colletotrichum fructicola]